MKGVITLRSAGKHLRCKLNIVKKKRMRPCPTKRGRSKSCCFPSLLFQILLAMREIPSSDTSMKVQVPLDKFSVDSEFSSDLSHIVSDLCQRCADITIGRWIDEVVVHDRPSRQRDVSASNSCLNITQPPLFGLFNLSGRYRDLCGDFAFELEKREVTVNMEFAEFFRERPMPDCLSS